MHGVSPYTHVLILLYINKTIVLICSLVDLTVNEPLNSKCSFDLSSQLIMDNDMVQWCCVSTVSNRSCFVIGTIVCQSQLSFHTSCSVGM